jgi:hypothetical protein
MPGLPLNFESRRDEEENQIEADLCAMSVWRFKDVVFTLHVGRALGFDRQVKLHNDTKILQPLLLQISQDV